MPLPVYEWAVRIAADLIRVRSNDLVTALRCHLPEIVTLRLRVPIESG
jgi:hypothetical protein